MAPGVRRGDGKSEFLICYNAIKIDGCVKSPFHRRDAECAEKRLIFK